MKMSVSRGTALVLFVSGVFFWGSNWPVTKLIVQSVPPLWAAVIRLALAAVCMFALQLCIGKAVIPSKQDMPAVLFPALTNMAFFIACMCIGLQYLPAGRSAVLSYTTAIWVPPAAWLLFREPVPRVRIIGALLGLAGIGVLFNPVSMDWSDRNILIGHGLLLAAPILWSASILYLSRHVWDSSPFQLVSWQMAVAMLVLLLPALALEGVPHIVISWKLVMLFGYASLLASCFAFWAMTIVNSVLPASTTSIGVAGTPVVGILTSALMLGEEIDLPLVLATVLILVGICIGSLPATRMRKG